MKLKAGEILCPQCNGTGFDEQFIKDAEQYCGCSKCKETGKLDWIEAVVGKNNSSQRYYNPIDGNIWEDDFNTKIKKRIK